MHGSLKFTSNQEETSLTNTDLILGIEQTKK